MHTHPGGYTVTQAGLPLVGLPPLYIPSHTFLPILECNITFLSQKVFNFNTLAIKPHNITFFFLFIVHIVDNFWGKLLNTFNSHRIFTQKAFQGVSPYFICSLTSLFSRGETKNRLKRCNLSDEKGENAPKGDKTLQLRDVKVIYVEIIEDRDTQSHIKWNI